MSAPSKPSIAWLTEHTHRPEMLRVVREWVSERRTNDADELLRLIDQRVRALAAAN